jgi:hypothetical protein
LKFDPATASQSRDEDVDMKPFGVVLCTVAFLAIALGFTFDTSVSTGLGGRVHNIGLMNEEQNILIVGGAMLIAGSLLLAISTRSKIEIAENTPGYSRCPSCAEMVKNEAKVCRHCQRDLPSLTEVRARDQAEKQQLAEATQLGGEAARRAEGRLPKGICPNCKETIPLASDQCKHCRASFEQGSSWRVLPSQPA